MPTTSVYFPILPITSRYHAIFAHNHVCPLLAYHYGWCIDIATGQCRYDTCIDYTKTMDAINFHFGINNGHTIGWITHLAAARKVEHGRCAIWNCASNPIVTPCRILTAAGYRWRYDLCIDRLHCICSAQFQREFYALNLCAKTLNIS